jgi:predicted nucleic acid-binding protein
VATYLLDSGILIDVLNAKRGRSDLIARLIRQGDELASCCITITEVHAGMRPGEEAKTERFLRSLKFHSVTYETSKAAGALQDSWRRQGRTLSLPDATIAAVALEHGLVLVTANARHYPMPELDLYPLPG